MRALVALLFVASCAGRAPVVDNPPSSGEGEGEGEGEGGGGGEGEGECTVDADCSPGLVCGSVVCVARCVAPAGEGDACFDNFRDQCGPDAFSTPCADGLYCLHNASDDIGDDFGSCVAPGALGDACGDGHGPCADGLVCVCESLTCADPSTPQCPDGEQCGLVCVQRFVQQGCVDVAPAQAGELCYSECNASPIERACADGLTCTAGCPGLTSECSPEGCCCG